MMNEILMDIKVLTELKLDIIKNGKIRQTKEEDVDGLRYPFACKEDLDRVKGLESVMEKYTYGWYIATETLEEQLQSITKFEQYLLSKIIKE